MQDIMCGRTNKPDHDTAPGRSRYEMAQKHGLHAHHHARSGESAGSTVLDAIHGRLSRRRLGDG